MSEGLAPALIYSPEQIKGLLKNPITQYFIFIKIHTKYMKWNLPFFAAFYKNSFGTFRIQFWFFHYSLAFIYQHKKKNQDMFMKRTLYIMTKKMIKFHLKIFLL